MNKPKPDFDQMTEDVVCGLCGGEIVRLRAGDEGWDVCTDCRAVEQEKHTIWVDKIGNIYYQEEFDQWCKEQDEKKQS